jgi:hypothetical protein
MPKTEITRIPLLLGMALVAQATFVSPSAANTTPCNDSRIQTEYDKKTRVITITAFMVLYAKRHRQDAQRTMYSKLWFLNCGLLHHHQALGP